MFEALSPVDKRYYCELVLRPMALRLLTLDDEPRYLEQARAAHPDDEIAALKMAHQAATDHLSSLGWVTRIMIDWRAGKDARKRETERRAKETAREEAKMGL